MEKGAYHTTWAGTPQGGAISPLLLNIALHGREQALGVRYNRHNIIDVRSPYAVVRYADDFVVLAKNQPACQQAKELLTPWLGERGLKLSESKTRTIHLSEGLNFLGVTIRHYKQESRKRKIVTLIKPSREAEQAVRERLKSVWKTVQSSSVEEVIAQLNAKILGWGKYYAPYSSTRTFKRLDHWMWQKQARHCYRQHPQKGWRWRKERYWGVIPGRRDRWVFKSHKTGKYMWKFSWLPKRPHILVKGRSSVDDPTQQVYWRERQGKQGRTLSGIRAKLWYKQQGQCAHCGAELEAGSKTHITISSLKAREETKSYPTCVYSTKPVTTRCMVEMERT